MWLLFILIRIDVCLIVDIVNAAFLSGQLGRVGE
jgi:hypothetical protein